MTPSSKTGSFWSPSPTVHGTGRTGPTQRARGIGDAEMAPRFLLSPGAHKSQTAEAMRTAFRPTGAVKTAPTTRPARAGHHVACEFTFEVCGDGVIGGDEACDDANAISGDGCSAPAPWRARGQIARRSWPLTPMPLMEPTHRPRWQGGEAPLAVHCDMTGEGGPHTLPVWAMTAPALVHL